MNDWYAASGTYAIMVGNASDSISEEVQIQFNASRCLPISIAGDTTVGELMSDPRTAKVIDVLTKNFANSNTPTHSEEGEGLGASEEQMNQAIMMYMPLISMQSFLPISDFLYPGFLRLMFLSMHDPSVSLIRRCIPQADDPSL